MQGSQLQRNGIVTSCASVLVNSLVGRFVLDSSYLLDRTSPNFFVFLRCQRAVPCSTPSASAVVPSRLVWSQTRWVAVSSLSHSQGHQVRVCLSSLWLES